jgi:hypothetical protein
VKARSDDYNCGKRKRNNDSQMFVAGTGLCNSEAGHSRPFMVAPARATKKMTLREKCESLCEAERSPLAEGKF